MMARVMMYCLCAREERDREDARRVQELLEKEVSLCYSITPSMSSFPG